MKVIRIYSAFLVFFSLLFIHCEQIETEIQISVSLSERVTQDVELYALIFNSSPDLSSTPTNYAKRIPLFKTSEAPKAAIIPSLTVDETIYILLFADINDDGELNITEDVITEPIGGFGISPESSQLTPLTIIEGMETIDIIVYHPEEIFGTYSLNLSGTITINSDVPLFGNLYVALLKNVPYSKTQEEYESLLSLENPTSHSNDYNFGNLCLGDTLFVLAFLDYISDNKLTTSPENMPLEPTGSFGLDPAYSVFSSEPVIMHGSQTNIDLNVHHPSDFKNYIPNHTCLSGNVTIDENVAGSGDVLLYLFKNNPIPWSGVSPYQIIPALSDKSFKSAPVLKGQEVFITAFLDTIRNGEFDTYGEIPLGIEPLGIYGSTPGNPEPTAINTSQDTTDLDITIYNITELYGNYVSTISGTVTIDESVAETGNLYILIHLQNPTVFTNSPIWSFLAPGAESLRFYSTSPLLNGYAYYIAGYIDVNDNKLLDIENNKPIEPFGVYGVNKPEDSAIYKYLSTNLTDVDFTIYKPEYLFP